MKCLSKLCIIVLVGLISVGFILLNSQLFNINEGMDNNSSASTLTKKEEAAKNKINKLKTELDKLTPELNANKKDLSNIQTKIDLLSSQIQAKQSEIDKIQNQIDVDNLAKTT